MRGTGISPACFFTAVSARMHVHSAGVTIRISGTKREQAYAAEGSAASIQPGGKNRKQFAVTAVVFLGDGCSR